MAQSFKSTRRGIVAALALIVVCGVNCATAPRNRSRSSVHYFSVDHSIAATESHVALSGSTGRTFTLPKCQAAVSGREIRIENSAAAGTALTISGSTFPPLTALYPGDGVHLRCDGRNSWLVE